MTQALSKDTKAVSRNQLRGKVQTVCGLIEPDALGKTLMHEHLLWDIRTAEMKAAVDQGPEISLCNCFRINYDRVKYPRNRIFRNWETATSEVKMMLEVGGQSIVELSSGGLAPDPFGLRTISENTGAHVVMGCGHYVDSYQDQSNHERSVDSFAKEVIAQVLEGAWGTDVRAGIIGEIGCQSPWTDLEKRVMRGALIAQAETGAALNVHPGRHPDQPQEVVDFVAKHGYPLERVIISHIDRTIFDHERLLRLADTGCVLEFDLFGQEYAYYSLGDIDGLNDAQRLKYIRMLIKHGHLSQILISHDICHQTRLVNYGGHGYGHIYENVIPIMRRHGFTEQEISTILVENPKRLLTFL
ncbi:aryldialkylphosphatase [Ottowia sp. GY511]|uniref:Phosphotriesterase n=2 Tax=Comamonadaceae TaxID=80864 RepID=A0ABW4KXH0_9BURK|nr:aryldialkylphosphatase [Ottowia sp. GY511]